MEPGDDASRTIRHAHLEAGIREVLAGKRVMHQSLFAPEVPAAAAFAARGELPAFSWALPLSVAAFATAIVALIVALAL